MGKVKIIFMLALLFPLFLNAKKTDSNDSKELKRINCTDYKKLAGKLTDQIKVEGYKVENSLPSGYVKDGSVDYTSELQTALNDHLTLIFPGFPILVNDKGLQLRSDQKIFFENGSEIHLKSTASQGYNILKLTAVSNVCLINPVIIGDRAGHLENTGQHGMGIGLYSSSNTLIFNPKVTDCWGDGIYFGTSKEHANTPNINTTIVNAFLKNNRRNNCSVISVDGLYFIDPYFGFGNGTEPQDGIDFEPNRIIDELKNIYLINPKTEENVNEGIQICLLSWYKVTTGEPITKEMSFTILNHKDNKSGWPVYLSYRKKEHANTVVSLKGTVKFYNPEWINNPKAVIRNGMQDPGVMTSFINPKITINGISLNKTEVKAIIEKQTEGGTIEIVQD